MKRYIVKNAVGYYVVEMIELANKLNQETA